MGFISYSLAFYEKELQKIEAAEVTGKYNL